MIDPQSNLAAPPKFLKTTWKTIEESAKLLHSIFPDYPNLSPYKPPQTKEPA